MVRHTPFARLPAPYEHVHADILPLLCSCFPLHLQPTYRGRRQQVRHSKAKDVVEEDHVQAWLMEGGKEGGRGEGRKGSGLDLFHLSMPLLAVLDSFMSPLSGSTERALPVGAMASAAADGGGAAAADDVSAASASVTRILGSRNCSPGTASLCPCLVSPLFHGPCV